MNPMETRAARAAAWPALPRSAWQDTYATLHRWMQIVGKTRLALSPMENHYWHVALYTTARGLTTSPMPSGDRLVQVDFDFIDHQLVARTSDSETRMLPLEPKSVADFYREYLDLLRGLDLDVSIRPMPNEIPDAVPFPEDRAHASYDREAAHACWRALSQVDRVFKRFRNRFLGKQSPVHFWWGSFDHACTRFSGRTAPPHPGGVPNLPDRVVRESYSHECASVGWWPGTEGSSVPEPAFYAYAYPEPPGYAEAPARSAGARYDTTLREWVLPYEIVCRAPDPDSVLLEFLQSTYENAARLGGWDRAALERQL
ncbi:MAG TPA: DUF5996 family protein [Candidatus Eisenbacteria bacterium]|nr:DUF5996 family protein [Candidatus Eisenbacteria bacterium]